LSFLLFFRIVHPHFTLHPARCICNRPLPRVRVDGHRVSRSRRAARQSGLSDHVQGARLP
jgi:hypothetical protein